MSGRRAAFSTRSNDITRIMDSGRRRLQREGKKFIGYVCSFVPLEIMTAAGLIPFRVRGNIREPITKGDTLLETIVCPYYRSCFDLSVKGKYDFLSGHGDSPRL